jgi:hypothetical protein
MTRSVIAVIVGYLIFALSAFAFFQISGQPPHQSAPMPFMLGSIAVGTVFALIGGLRGRVARSAPTAGTRICSRNRTGARCDDLTSRCPRKGCGLVAGRGTRAYSAIRGVWWLAALEAGKRCLTPRSTGRPGTRLHLGEHRRGPPVSLVRWSPRYPQDQFSWLAQ